MTPERSTDEIIAEIERTSRRVRPLLIIGMVVIVGSLIASAFYLDYLRKAAERDAERWRILATRSVATQMATGQRLERGDVEGARRLLGLSILQTKELAHAAGEAAPAGSRAAAEGTAHAPPGQAARPGPRDGTIGSAGGTKVQAFGEPKELTQMDRALEPIVATVINKTSKELVCGPAWAWASGNRQLRYKVIAGGRMRTLGGIRCEPPVRQIVFSLAQRQTYELRQLSDGSVTMSRAIAVGNAE